jgi:phytoene synthase
MGRLYLPADWMREVGLDPGAWLAAPSFDERLGRVVRRLLAAADELYARGAAGIARLPAGCRPAIRAAAALYAEIGREVARRGHDSVTGRAVVPPMRKVAVLGRSALAGGARAGLMALPPVASARFLVEAVARTGVRSARTPVAWWQVEARTIRILELFERMAERDRLGATRP